jgi:DNA polymerase-3 subunit epsilon
VKIHKKFWWFLTVTSSATVVVLYTNFYLLWTLLSPGDQATVGRIVHQHLGYFCIAIFFLLLVIGFTVEWFFRFYIIPVNQLTQEIHLINTVNPTLRARVHGSQDVRYLAKTINQQADVLANLKQSYEQQIEEAKSKSENEKEILAALLSDLPQGILVCNADGQIVFYNRKVKDLLARYRPSGGDQDGDTQWIGLGRSVYGFVDSSLISRALKRVEDKLAQNQPLINERFLIKAKDESMLPAELLPVLNPENRITGFILYIEDLQAERKRKQAVSQHLQSWQHQMIQSISVVKTAAEILMDETSPSPQVRDQMIRLLAEQSNLAAELLAKSDVHEEWSSDDNWPLTPTSVAEWSQFITQQVEETLEFELGIDNGELELQVSIDRHHLTGIVLFVLKKAAPNIHPGTARGRFRRQSSWLYLDITWQGEAVSNDLLKKWKSQPLELYDARLSLPLADILAYHGAKLWLCGDPESPERAGITMLLPIPGSQERARPGGRMTILPEARPEYYDFNLFQQAGQSSELDNRPLTELTYTVFDTETTGLDPKGGDEIISIGAVRIVNGRLLKKEKFDQLVNPQRHVPRESIKYHGIQPLKLKNQPTIDKVLPEFHRFARDTILVGHNVAFDMRMLQLKEEQTGIRFTNPILDTLLLSAVVHPLQRDHSLNVLSERLGISIVGRHTALGDAMATAQILIKLIALLGELDITTLLQARQASQKTLFSRLKY